MVLSTVTRIISHGKTTKTNKQTTKNKLGPKLVRVDVNGLMDLKPELFILVVPITDLRSGWRFLCSV